MSYTASLRQNPGRTSWLVEFRHPLKFDKAGKPGRKVRKGLGDCTQEQAKSLVKQLNQLLKDKSLWSKDTKSVLRLGFDARVIEIFYDNLEVNPVMHREIREQYLPFPAKDVSRRVLLLGRTGAGKTTLLRQLIGSDNKLDRFPSTSTNRTTTCEIEVICTENNFSGVVTFMPEDEVRFKVEELVSAAILEAVDGASQEKIARVFLEDRDQRFRLKYLLGDFKKENQDEEDPYTESSDEEEADNDNTSQVSINFDELQNKLNKFLDSIKQIATSTKQEFEQNGKSLTDISSQEKYEALDLIQEKVETSDDFISLVSEVMEEIRCKFSLIPCGQLLKSSTGWGKVWQLDEEPDRSKFIEAVKYFSSNSANLWGTLVSPLVTGIRVQGSCFPKWSENKHPIVLIDTEGLGHKATAEANLPNSMVDWFDQVDVILLVDKATDSMVNSVGKALETIAATGHTQKLIIAFTHMDELKGDNFRNLQDKKDHLKNSIRNVIQNQLEKRLTKDLAKAVEDHLEENSFFLGFISSKKEKYLNKVKADLIQMLERIIDLSSPDSSTVFPDYNFDKLVLAIRDGISDFRDLWKSLLDLEEGGSSILAADWQSVKALTRKYSEGLDDNSLKLKPTADLRSSLGNIISNFLDHPNTWNGNPSLEEKKALVDKIKARFTKHLIPWVEQRVRKQPRKDWCEAFSYNMAISGRGSTKLRALRIESLYEFWIPIPTATGNLEQEYLIDEIKDLVKIAIDEVKKEIQESV